MDVWGFKLKKISLYYSTFEEVENLFLNFAQGMI